MGPRYRIFVEVLKLLTRRKKTPRAMARERLQLIIMQDRGIIAAPQLMQMRREIFEVVSRYAKPNP